MLLAQRFELLDELGEGGMGVVSRARDLETNALVAVKRVRPGLRLRPRVLKRFAAEANALAQIDHPSVVHLVYNGLRHEEQFIALQLVEGPRLTDVLDSEGPMPISEAIEVALILCDALEAIHAAGVLHRNLSPSNVLIEETSADSFRVWLTDFTFARLGSTALTGLQESVGTPSFMAPEQTVGDPQDQRTDVYGLGALLYVMLTACWPLEASKTERELAYALRRYLPSASIFRSGIPNDLELVINTALRKAPHNRYPSIAEMRRDLERLTRRHPGATRGVAPRRPDVYRPTHAVSMQRADLLDDVLRSGATREWTSDGLRAWRRA